MHSARGCLLATASVRATRIEPRTRTPRLFGSRGRSSSCPRTWTGAQAPALVLATWRHPQHYRRHSNDGWRKGAVQRSSAHIARPDLRRAAGFQYFL